MNSPLPLTQYDRAVRTYHVAAGAFLSSLALLALTSILTWWVLVFFFALCCIVSALLFEAAYLVMRRHHDAWYLLQDLPERTEIP